MRTGQDSRSGRSGQVNLLDRPRYMCREWNPRKAKALRALSVPNLKLFPTNRPLFHCRRCHFSNDRYHICLFCGWTSKGAEEEFQGKIKRRTISSPYRLEFFSLHQHVQEHIPSQSVARSPESLQIIPNNPIPTPTTSISDGVALSCEEVSLSRGHDGGPRMQTAPDNDDNDNRTSSGSIPVADILPTSSHKGNPCASDCQSRCRVDAKEVAVVTATSAPIPKPAPTSTSSSGSDSASVLASAATRAAVCEDRYEQEHDTDNDTDSNLSQVSRPHNAHFPDSVDRLSTSTSPAAGMRFTTTSTMNLSSSHSDPVIWVLADVSNCKRMHVHSETNMAADSSDVEQSSSSPTSISMSSSAHAQRTLRHKKRQAMLHFSAPTPPSSEPSSNAIGNKLSSSTMNTVRSVKTIRPQSHPHTQLPSSSSSTVMSSTSSTSIPITRIPTHSRSQSQPDVQNAQLPLGNKARPYYTAIRKDMAMSSASPVMPGPRPTSTSSSSKGSVYDLSSRSSRASSTPPRTSTPSTSSSAAASRSALSSSSFLPTSGSSLRAHSPGPHPHPIFTPNPRSRIPIPSFSSSSPPSSSSPFPWSSQSSSSSREAGLSRPSTSSIGPSLNLSPTSNTNGRPSLDSTRSSSPSTAWLFDSNISNIDLNDIDDADDSELPTPVFSPPLQSPFPFHQHLHQHHAMSASPVSMYPPTMITASQPSSPLAGSKSGSSSSFFHVHVPSRFRRHTANPSLSQPHSQSLPLPSRAPRPSSSSSSYAFGSSSFSANDDDYVFVSASTSGTNENPNHDAKHNVNRKPSLANLASKLHLRNRRHTAPPLSSTSTSALSSRIPKIVKLSKKEETQLRMALAREVGHGGLVPDEGYVYKEKEKRGSRRGRSSASRKGSGSGEFGENNMDHDEVEDEVEEKSGAGSRRSKREMIREVKAFVKRRLS